MKEITPKKWWNGLSDQYKMRLGNKYYPQVAFYDMTPAFIKNIYELELKKKTEITPTH